MSTRDMAFETFEILQDRIDFIELLSNRPMEKGELRDEFDVSRSTVDRATRELENAGLISNSSGQFELTSLGRAAAAEFSNVLESIALRHWLEPFLKWVPDSEFDVDLAWFQDAKLLVPESGTPYEMIERHVEVLKDVEEGWFLLPFTGLHATEAAYEPVMGKNATIELVVNTAVAETFQSNPEYTSIISELTATGRTTIYSTEREIPYALNRIDDTLQIISADGDEPRALVETNNEQAIEWATEVYERYKTAAERISL